MGSRSEEKEKKEIKRFSVTNWQIDIVSIIIFFSASILFTLLPCGGLTVLEESSTAQVIHADKCSQYVDRKIGNYVSETGINNSIAERIFEFRDYINFLYQRFKKK